jgi:hypothetical protein
MMKSDAAWRRRQQPSESHEAQRVMTEATRGGTTSARGLPVAGVGPAIALLLILATGCATCPPVVDCPPCPTIDVPVHEWPQPPEFEPLVLPVVPPDASPAETVRLAELTLSLLRARVARLEAALEAYRKTP